MLQIGLQILPRIEFCGHHGDGLAEFAHGVSCSFTCWDWAHWWSASQYLAVCQDLACLFGVICFLLSLLFGFLQCFLFRCIFFCFLFLTGPFFLRLLWFILLTSLSFFGLCGLLALFSLKYWSRGNISSTRRHVGNRSSLLYIYIEAAGTAAKESILPQPCGSFFSLPFWTCYCFPETSMTTPMMRKMIPRLPRTGSLSWSHACPSWTPCPAPNIG